MKTNSRKPRNQIGQKIAYGSARQHEGRGQRPPTLNAAQHWRDMKAQYWSDLCRRRLRSREVKNLIQAERSRGYYFAASIAAKYSP